MLLALVSIAASGQFATKRFYAWQGKLGTDISFRLELEQASNGLVIGETTYFRKNGKTANIPVYGFYLHLEDGDELVLTEYDGRTACGTFIIEIDQNGELQCGKWSHLDKELDLNEINKVSFSYGKHEKFIYPATGAQCNGEYGFRYKTGNPNWDENGGYAELKVGINGKQIKWEMNQVTPNIAEGSGTSALITNTFSGKVGSFKFKAYIYKDCLYVINTNPQDAPWDEFGAHATLEGIYLKHNTKK